MGPILQWAVPMGCNRISIGSMGFNSAQRDNRIQWDSSQWDQSDPIGILLNGANGILLNGTNGTRPNGILNGTQWDSAQWDQYGILFVIIRQFLIFFFGGES